MGKGSSNTTTTQKSDPWEGVQPYLTGKGGIYPEAQNLFNQGKWSGDQQALTDQYAAKIGDRVGQANSATQFGWDTLGGIYDSKIQPVGNTRLPNEIAAIAGPTAAQDITYDAIKGADKIAANSIGLGNGVNTVASQSVDPAKAMQAMGQVDPTAALKQLLSGQVNTATLDPVIDNATRRMTQNFNEQVMPGINSQAAVAGQYGSSRQGIAQGLAMKGLSQSVGDMSADMYNNAYNTAQQNMYGTANSLSGQAMQSAHADADRDLNAQKINQDTSLASAKTNAELVQRTAEANAANQLAMQQFNAANELKMQQFNAELALQNNQQQAAIDQFNANLGLQNNQQGMAADQFNANLGLQNNQQQMADAQQMLNNRAQGLNLIGTGNALQDQTYQQQMGLLNAGNQSDWNNLNKYASIITPGAGLGSTSSSTSPGGGANPLSSALGGGLVGAQAASLLPTALGVTGPVGAAIGAGLGLMGIR